MSTELDYDPAKLGPCIEWKGAINAYGYGVKWKNGKTCLAHRKAWELANGPIPRGKIILHLCDNRRCINVNHLRLGTHADNTADAIAKNRWAPGIPKRINQDEVLTLLEKGMKQREIAEQLNCSRRNINRIAIKLGIRSTRPRLSKPEDYLIRPTEITCIEDLKRCMESWMPLDYLKAYLAPPKKQSKKQLEMFE